MSQDANNGSSDVQPPAPGVPAAIAAIQLPDAVTEEELMSSGHGLPEGHTCPLCCLPMAPSDLKRAVFLSCCSKTVCDGCNIASHRRGIGNVCAFCRTPMPDSDAAILAQLRKRVDIKDPDATFILAKAYYYGGFGLQQDIPRAVQLWMEMARLGDMDAQSRIGFLYFKGEGVEKDVARAIRLWQHTAIQGHPQSRHALGAHEDDIGNHGLAVQHWMISAKMGLELSLIEIKLMFMKGHATEAQHAEALRGCQTALEEARSPQHEEAKAFFNGSY
ncbi:hypothetical protein THAOC_28839 [Thalassiosira oceanica]|uniref:RING-type domain-containing protein n=1 Tax=Thalassiosira oceanica TaxID=159749 RepID=K0RSN6_THAOC|nr:hypothetical protein THAOC_28839 [Thalassiosira oceanica]|eukprot:EJK51941.1 hypothetical protein THAOC_28839 [Thalassiosira oceanica]